MNRFRRLLIVTILALLPNLVQAGLIVSISSTSVAPGSDFDLDVTLHSDTPEALNFFVLSYQISAPGLQFFTDGSGKPDQPQLANPNYVFYGNSAETSGSPAGTVASTNFPNDTYTQTDATIASAVTVDTTDVLLATLHLVATQPGTYQIVIDTSNSFFTSPDGVIDFSSNTGSVTVTGATVPEPSSLSLFFAGLTALGGWAVRRHQITAVIN